MSDVEEHKGVYFIISVLSVSYEAGMNRMQIRREKQFGRNEPLGSGLSSSPVLSALLLNEG